METTTVVKEDHHSCSFNLVAKPVESPTKIDSVSVDLINANDIDTRKCEHFSIRGYASEMRKKDRKKSWPFALDGGQNIFKEQSCKLPPLLVPKFRWWCCQSCLQKTEAKCSINEERIVTNNSSKSKSFGSCSHVPSRGDAVRCSSNLQWDGKINVDSRKSGDLASVNVNSSACHPLVSDQRTELVKDSESHRIASTVYRVPDAIKTHRDEHPSLELDDCDYASSESDEVLPGTVSDSLHRRKNRKVRLLTELLGKNKDEKTNVTSTDDSPSSTIPDASIGIDSISASQGQANSQGNVTSSLARRKKRKMPHDEEWVPEEFMCSPNNGHKNLKSFNRDAETDDGITSSDSEGTINRSSSQTAAKSNLVNAEVNKSPILGKKKIKNSQNFDEFSSLCLSRDNLQKERQKKPLGDTTKSDATDIVLNKSKAEKISSLLKKKSKVHEDHDWQGCRVPWNNDILREGLISRENVEMGQTGNVAAPFEVTQDTPAEKGVQFSLSNCLPAKRYDATYSTPISDGQGHVLSEYNTKRKGLNMNYVTQADAYVWKGMHVDLNSNQTTDKIPFLDEKQYRSPAEVGSSLIQLMDFSGTRNNGKNVEFQDRATVSSRKHYDKCVEMASEQGSVDDIMEIVELMAKNQYERCLSDTEIDKQLPETRNSKNHLSVDLNKTYENEEMNLFQETTDEPKSQAKNERIGKILRGDNVGCSKQKSVDYFSHIDRSQCNMSQMEQSYSPAGFRPFPQCGEKPLNWNSAQNCQWVGNMAAQKTSHANMQALGDFNTCHRVSQQNKEAAHVWSSMMSNSMPYMPSIPHKCAGQVAKLDMLRHCPSSLPNDDQNFLNLGSNCEKYCRKFDSESLRGTYADYPFSCKHNGTESLDLHSNETIPAMHLLSLMDAGLQSGEPVDVDGNQRFVKRTSFLPDHHSKELSSMSSDGYRTNLMKHPPFDCQCKSHLTGVSMSVCQPLQQLVLLPLHSSMIKVAIKHTTCQFSLKSREKEKKKCSDSERQNKIRKSQKAASSNIGLNSTCGSIPVHSMPKMAFGNSEFVMFPGKLHSMECATKPKQKPHTSSVTLFHPKSGSEYGICSINRNPADFTVPGAGNMYMIGSEDLKFGKKKAPSSGLAKLVGHKRQRKLTVSKKHSRNRTS